jgi:hypothetical protein
MQPALLSYRYVRCQSSIFHASSVFVNNKWMTTSSSIFTVNVSEKKILLDISKPDKNKKAISQKLFLIKISQWDFSKKLKLT